MSQAHEEDEDGGLDDQFALIEISVKCRELKKMDWFSNTDPFCVLSVAEQDAVGARARDGRISKIPSGRSTELGRTEVVRDTRNPDFCATFKMNYIFEEQQVIIVRVFDEDKRGSTNLKKHGFVGSATLTLSELMTARGRSLKLPLGKKGFVIIHAEEVSPYNDELHFQFAGRNLKNTDGMFGKSDPYFTISKMQGDGEFCQIFRSEVVKDCLFPLWKAQELPMQKACSGDQDRPLKIQVWDHDNNVAHDKIGVVDTTVRQLLDRSEFDVICNGKPFGSLVVKRAEIKEVPTFLEYLSGSCRMRFVTAVDFSSSNREPTSRDSLHLIDHRGFPNEYQAAVGAVGSILQDYCVGMRCSFYGFGMKESAGSLPAHVFPIGDPAGVEGVCGILDAYRGHLGNSAYKMSEPTLLAPLIRTVASIASETTQEDCQEYTVLLIITDGGINDYQQVVDEMCTAAEAPLSIVIVGVGDGDGDSGFLNMEKLDSDGEVLVSSRGNKCQRDIVQFVNFRKCSRNASRLTAETLAEIPRQLVEYFYSKGIMPTPPQEASAVAEEDIGWSNGIDAMQTTEPAPVRAEASPIIFIDSTPLVEATAVAVDEEPRPAVGAVSIAAESQGSSPEVNFSTEAVPETYAKHHGVVSPQADTGLSSSSAKSSAAPETSWLAQKLGRHQAKGGVPGTAVFESSQKKGMLGKQER